MKLRPLSDKIVVERAEVSDRSPGGIIIPDSAQQKSQAGWVIAVGPGKKTGKPSNWYGDEPIDSRETMDVKVGDQVIFTKYCGHEQELGNGYKVLVMSESDVLGVLEAEDELKAVG